MLSSCVIFVLRANTQKPLDTRRWLWQLIGFKKFILTYGDYMIHPYCQEKFILAGFLMSLFANHEFSYFRAKTSFLMPLNFGCCKPKLIGKNSDIYKPITRENLLIPYLKTFAIKKAL